MQKFSELSSVTKANNLSSKPEIIPAGILSMLIMLATCEYIFRQKNSILPSITIGSGKISFLSYAETNIYARYLQFIVQFTHIFIVISLRTEPSEQKLHGNESYTRTENKKNSNTNHENQEKENIAQRREQQTSHRGWYRSVIYTVH